MPLRIFSKENSAAARREQADRIERALISGFRHLSNFLKRAADVIETKRLERNGYEQQEKFLERTPPPPKDRP